MSFGLIQSPVMLGRQEGGGGRPGESSQLPTTLEEFLAAENLSDWPYPMALEGPLDISSEALLLGSQEDVADILREAAPLGVGMLAGLEQKLTDIEETLGSYAVHILSDDLRPSRLSERLFHSPSRTFLTEASNSDVVRSHHSSRGHRRTDFADAMLEARKRSMDCCVFPGFRHGELLELPAQLEAPQLLHTVTNIQNFNAGFRSFWKKLFLSEASCAVLQDLFWWIFLSRFNKGDQGSQEDRDSLFDRIADSYVALFSSVNADVKDKFLSVYPDCLAQAVYSVYATAFPEARVRFDDTFQQFLVNLTHQWVTGVKPVPGSFSAWDLEGLQAVHARGRQDISSTTKKMMEAAALNKQVELSLDLEGFHKVITKLGEEPRTPGVESREVSKVTGVSGSGPSQSRLAILPAKKTTKESHQMGPGPEYERVKFNTQGRSPLIAHYLHMRQLRHYRQPGSKVRRTEIARLPQPGPTYQEFIEDKMSRSDALNKEFTRICEDTAAEIVELERKKREMNRDIERLKQELTYTRTPNERKDILDRFAQIRDRDRETPLLDTTRGESELSGSTVTSDED